VFQNRNNGYNWAPKVTRCNSCSDEMTSGPVEWLQYTKEGAKACLIATNEAIRITYPPSPLLLLVAEQAVAKHFAPKLQSGAAKGGERERQSPVHVRLVTSGPAAAHAAAYCALTGGCLCNRTFTANPRDYGHFKH
jgi:hypothetical protein